MRRSLKFGHNRNDPAEEHGVSKVGVCDIDNKKRKDILIFSGVLLITIIRQYFAECVIVLVS